MNAYINRFILALIFGYILISSAYLYSSWSRNEQFLSEKFHQANKVSAEMSAQALDFFFHNLKTSVNIFMETHQEALVKFSNDPSDDALYESILRSIKQYFPQVRSFTLAKKDGSPIYEDFNGLINSVCVTDIKRFSINPNGDVMRLHPNPLFYHIDVMLPWAYQSAGKLEMGVFFINYPAKFVTEILHKFHTDGVQLMMVQKKNPLRIDFTDKGARNTYERNWLLTQQEFDSLKYAVKHPVEHTRWTLVAYTNPKVYEKEHEFFTKGLITQFAEVLLLGILLFATVIFYHHQNFLKRKVLHDLAHNDQLTGLPNRAQFLMRLKQSLLIAGREKFKLSVLFIDLNDFKPVNDKYGHHIGDLLLKEVAQRLLAGRRQCDIVARFGGDEFLIALSDVGAGEALDNIIEKIKVEITKPINIEGLELKVGASIGKAIFDDDASSLEELIEIADEQMYKVKRESKTNSKA